MFQPPTIPITLDEFRGFRSFTKLATSPNKELVRQLHQEILNAAEEMKDRLPNSVFSGHTDLYREIGTTVYNRTGHPISADAIKKVLHQYKMEVKTIARRAGRCSAAELDELIRQDPITGGMNCSFLNNIGEHGFFTGPRLLATMDRIGDAPQGGTAIIQSHQQDSPLYVSLQALLRQATMSIGLNPGLTANRHVKAEFVEKRAHAPLPAAANRADVRGCSSGAVEPDPQSPAILEQARQSPIVQRSASKRPHTEASTPPSQQNVAAPAKPELSVKKEQDDDCQIIEVKKARIHHSRSCSPTIGGPAVNVETSAAQEPAPPNKEFLTDEIRRFIACPINMICAQDPKYETLLREILRVFHDVCHYPDACNRLIEMNLRTDGSGLLAACRQ
ncbi:unnamed protein product [Caenorhabditis sp. 36 PRJEB53466]|nr:unnamed protein product [Caenorhabditis sp. 36 PRJEB53466]